MSIPTQEYSQWVEEAQQIAKSKNGQSVLGMDKTSQEVSLGGQNLNRLLKTPQPSLQERDAADERAQNHINDGQNETLSSIDLTDGIYLDPVEEDTQIEGNLQNQTQTSNEEDPTANDTLPSEMTPFQENRTQKWPEENRFMGQETPSTNRGPILNRNSSDSSDFKTPQLPINPFGKNPFGPDLGEDLGGGMGLTQAFKNTQAASSPLLIRTACTSSRLQHLASSQRPSPNAPIRDDILPSDIVSEPATVEKAREAELTDPSASSPLASIICEGASKSRKRVIELSEEENESEGDLVQQRPKKKRRRDVFSIPDVSPDNTRRRKAASMLTDIKSRKQKDFQPSIARQIPDDDDHSSEASTEQDEEDEGSDPIEVLDDDEDIEDIEANKENRYIPSNIPLPQGTHLTRAKEPIPASSSPARLGAADIKTLHEDLPHTSGIKSVQSSGIVQASPLPTSHNVPDSQASQKPGNQKDAHDVPQLRSSNESRNVILQSQAVHQRSPAYHQSSMPRPAAATSQHTASPPESRAGSFQNGTHSNNMHVNAQPDPSTPPASSLSSDPGVTDCDKIPTDQHILGKDPIEDDERLDINVPENTRHPCRQTPGSRGSRNKTTVPETEYSGRHDNAFERNDPKCRKDEFEAADGFNKSIGRRSYLQSQENSPTTGTRSLAGSFASKRSDRMLKSPVEASPRKGKPFASIPDVPFATQSQASFDVQAALWDGDDSAVLLVQDTRPAVADSDPDSVRGHLRRPRGTKSGANETSNVEQKPALQRRYMPTEAPASHRPNDMPDINLTDRDVSSDAGQPKIVPEAQSRSAVETINDDNNNDFMELRTLKAKNVYGRRAKSPMKPAKVEKATRKEQIRGKKSTLAVSPKATNTGTGPAIKEVKVGKKGKRHMSQVDSSATLCEPLVHNSSRSSRRGIDSDSTANAKTSLSMAATLSTEEPHAVATARIFAEFRGSPPGFFAATCLACFEGETELKYDVRFDDGTVDQLGSAKVRRLELIPGDEVKVDRRNLKSRIFIVTGFGKVLDEETMKTMQFPMTDVYGHEMVSLVEKTLLSREAQSNAMRLEIPVTEVCLAKSMWSAFKDRVYQHVKVDKEPMQQMATPLPSRLPSTVASPASRTRSNQKIEKPSFSKVKLESLSGRAHEKLKMGSGIFDSVVFVFTNVGDKLRQNLDQAIRKQGGRTLSGFSRLFEIEEPRDLDLEEAEKDSDTEIKHPDPGLATKPSGIRIREAFKEIKLAVLITPSTCRNHKYFEALSFGIPCLSLRWVQDCLATRTFKSWRPYLLAAGESDFIGGWTSQHLNITRQEIEDSSMRLSEIISRRQQWLKGFKVLLVGSGSDNSSKERLTVHVFIAWSLGAAEVAVVGSVKDAERHLRNSDIVFDWICIDNEKDKEKDKSKVDRKSRRVSALGAIEILTGLVNTEKTRVVGAQLVIQSLIAGELVDWEET